MAEPENRDIQDTWRHVYKPYSAMQVLHDMKRLFEAWKQRTIQPIIGLARRGLSSEKVAAGVAVGAAIGLMPLLGLTTVLGCAAAFLFRLNIIAVQAALWLVYPLQLVLLVPYFRWGHRLCTGTHFPLAADDLNMLLAGCFHTIVTTLGVGALYATALWAVSAVFLIPLIFFSTRAILRLTCRKD